MNISIIWLENAKYDLIQIYNYILIDSSYYAIKTVNEIMDKVKSIITFPYMFRKVQIYDDENIREIIYKSYKIIYEIDSNKIFVHRIFHSSRLFTNSILKINKFNIFI